ncbi:MAG: 50S ribosomal protein L14 [Methanobacteriaceae archaeon]|nr:50S ribosomal protein L14 [Methanobacteriaceae archaeon]HNK90412.1 50S ribosomal protein L14 [Chitinophagales bacterium]
MIYPETKLSVGDNSGAKLVKCVKVLKFSKSSGAKPASIAIVSIRKVKYSKRLAKGEISRGVIVRLKKSIQRDTGSSIRFDNNSLILIDPKNVPLGTRIFGPIFKELRFGDFPKILTLAKTII